MNPADIYYAYQELYRIAPTLSQEEYLKRDGELYDELKGNKKGNEKPMEIIDKGIFVKETGVWWAHSFLREGYASSLRTKDEDKAKAKYEEQLQQMRRAFEKYEVKRKK